MVLSDPVWLWNETMKAMRTTRPTRSRRRVVWAMLAVVWPASGTAASDGPTPAAASAPTAAPRFFVPDFRPVGQTDEPSWVALAVSESLRARLRRSTATTAVSGMRTAGVLQRLAEGDKSTPDEMHRIARLLGADWTVTGTVEASQPGRYELKLRVRHAAQADRDHARSIAAPSVGAILDGATDAVFDLTGVRLSEAQRKRVRATPGQTGSALEYYAKAIRAVRAGKPSDVLYYLAQSRQYDASFRPTMRLLGQVNIAAGNRREVLLIFEQLLRRARRDDDPVDVAFAMTQIAIAHQRVGDLKTAERYYQAAMAEARKVGLRDVQAVLFGAMATLRIDQGDSTSALELLAERLKLLQAQGDRLAIGPACMTVGLVHAAKKDPDQALVYLTLSAKLADEVGMSADKGAALYQIGELQKANGKLEEALEAYRASLAASEEREAGSAYRQIAEIHEQQGRHDEALDALRKAETILAKRKAYAQQADCLARIAGVYLKRNDTTKALSAMTEAVEILRDLGHPELAKYEKELANMRAKAGK